MFYVLDKLNDIYYFLDFKYIFKFFIYIVSYILNRIKDIYNFLITIYILKI